MLTRALLIVAALAVSTPIALAFGGHPNLGRISVVFDPALPNVTWKASRTFSENFADLPSNRHGISTNSSRTKSAKLLAAGVVGSRKKNPVTDIRPNRRQPMQSRKRMP